MCTFFTLWIGWGTYMGIGHNPTNYRSRIGVFDWLLGHDQPGWGFAQRWCRGYAGMALRGLAWTMPPGLLMYLHGYGWQAMLSGVLMSFVYELCNEVPPSSIGNPDFGAGIPLAELVWGSFVWLTLIASALAFRHENTRLWSLCRALRSRWCGEQVASVPATADDSDVLDVRGTTSCPAHGGAAFGRYAGPEGDVGFWPMHAGIGLIELIFIGSSIYYPQTNYDDPTNFYQTLIGLWVATGSLVTLHVFALAIERCIRSYQKRYRLSRLEAWTAVRHRLLCRRRYYMLANGADDSDVGDVGRGPPLRLGLNADVDAGADDTTGNCAAGLDAAARSTRCRVLARIGYRCCMPNWRGSSAPFPPLLALIGAMAAANGVAVLAVVLYAFVSMLAGPLCGRWGMVCMWPIGP